jgi:hypothetical protein
MTKENAKKRIIENVIDMLISMIYSCHIACIYQNIMSYLRNVKHSLSIKN